MKKIIILLIILFCVFFNTNLICKSKPKDFNLTKELYFNPKLPFSEIKSDIEIAGYRIIEEDTSEYRKIQYTIYRKIFGIETEKVYMYIENDTIKRIDIYYDINTIPKAKAMANFPKILKKNFAIDIVPHYDVFFCGDDYSVDYEFILRYETIDFFIPIDFEKTYYKIMIMPQIDLGKHSEDLKKAFDNLLKKGKKKSKISK